MKRSALERATNVSDFDLDLPARADTQFGPGKHDVFHALLIAEINFIEIWAEEGERAEDASDEESEDSDESEKVRPSELFGLTVQEKLDGGPNQYERVGSFSAYGPWNLPNTLHEQQQEVMEFFADAETRTVMLI